MTPLMPWMCLKRRARPCPISNASVCNLDTAQTKSLVPQASNSAVVDASNLTSPAPTDAAIQKRGRKTDDNGNAIAKFSV